MPANPGNSVTASTLAGATIALRRVRGKRGKQTTLWRSAAIVFTGNTIARALGFAFPVVLAHLLGRDEFALAYFFINGGFFVAEFVTASYATAMIRHIASEDSPSRQGTWLVAAMAGGIPMLFLAIIAGEAVSAVTGATPLLMTVMVIGLSIDIYYFGALSGLQKFGTLVGYRAAANLAQLALLAVIAALGAANVPAVVTLYAFIYLVPIVVIEVLRRPVWAVLRTAHRPTRSDFSALTRFAAPALVAGLAYGGVLGLDVVLVRLLAAGELATYGAARALALPMTMIPLALGVVLLPRVASTPEGERWPLLVRAVVVTSALSLVAGLGYLVFGELAVDAVFPASYHGAVGPLHALVPAMGLLGIYIVLSQWCLGAGFPTLPAWSLSLGALSACAADLLLVPRHGAAGAGIGMAIGLIAAIGLLWWLLFRCARPPEGAR
jgi:O-antigen/teichoic acid export membrane protein